MLSLGALHLWDRHNSIHACRRTVSNPEPKRGAEREHGADCRSLAERKARTQVTAQPIRTAPGSSKECSDLVGEHR